MSKLPITAIVLAYNEALHLERCLKSIKGVCKDIVVVDSFSTDATKQIALANGARFVQNPWVNYATQFNWALEHVNIKTEWVLRIDADEYLSEDLTSNLIEQLPTLKPSIHGVMIKRLMYFMDKPLRKAGMYPIWHIKLWRNGKAFCEQQWMDERMKLVSGEIAYIEGDLIDYNLNNLTWWTNKHNSYATREAIDILNKIYNFSNQNNLKGKLLGTSEERRRWFKNRYLKLPLFIRPILFWIVRYIFQGGFLEGKRGFIWNILQCGWYRFLVDAKIYEAYKKAGKNKENLILYFKQEYGYDVTKTG